MKVLSIVFVGIYLLITTLQASLPIGDGQANTLACG